jgi:DNA-binding transcriptional regulator YiaG
MNSKDILALRKQLGLSQQIFATKLGVGIITVSRWERGICKPSNMAEEKLKTMRKETKESK